MGWTFYNASGARLSSAATNISVLDIDGATALSGAVADADLFIIDDNASGANRKVTAAVLKTYTAAPTEATQAVLEEDTPGSSTANTYISPEVAHFHPGVAKVWFHILGTGTAARVEDYNVSGFSENSTGDYIITIGIDFASAGYAFVMGSVDGIVNNLRSSLHGGGSGAVGSISVLHATDDATSGVPIISDATRVMVAAFGDQ